MASRLRLGDGVLDDLEGGHHTQAVDGALP
jgi:hypothetical protein